MPQGPAIISQSRRKNLDKTKEQGEQCSIFQTLKHAIHAILPGTITTKHIDASYVSCFLYDQLRLMIFLLSDYLL